jgi:hypothetical protein
MQLIPSENDSCRLQREERDSLEQWEDDGGAPGQKHRRIPILLPSSMTCPTDVLSESFEE